MQNSLYFHSVGDRLLDAALGARKVFLCSPFIKQSALNKVLSRVDSEAEVTLVTKIDLDSFACGVSDISALREVLSKKGKVLILANLHLKYYRFNRCVFLGSANLTDKGLGWAYKPNVELLVQQMFGEIESLMEETILESSMILDYESLEKFELLFNMNCFFNKFILIFLFEFNIPNKLPYFENHTIEIFFLNNSNIN